MILMQTGMDRSNPEYRGRVSYGLTMYVGLLMTGRSRRTYRVGFSFLDGIYYSVIVRRTRMLAWHQFSLTRRGEVRSKNAVFLEGINSNSNSSIGNEKKNVLVCHST